MRQDYAENTLDYVAISIVNKIHIKSLVFNVYTEQLTLKQKVPKSLTHNLR